MTITARTLAGRLEASLAGNPAAQDTPLGQLAPLDKAQAGDLSFLASEKYRKALPGCRATTLLLKASQLDSAPPSAAVVVVPDPYLAYARVSALFSREPHPAAGVHPSAVVDPGVQLGERAAVGANSVIEAGCEIGDDCVIGPGVVLGARVRLGARTVLKANVTVHYDVGIGRDCVVHSGAVIGGDGFGFAPGPNGWEKIAQLGRVIIGDRVEIGANTTIDRGAIDDTVIDDGVIIDNLVMLAHNVRVGSGTAMAAQVGIAGSTRVGAGCILGGQAGLAGHLSIAPGSQFMGQAMVTKGTTEAGIYASGWPIQPAREWRRTVARLRQLERLEARLKGLEQRLGQAGTEPTSEEDSE
ncbi:MAG: UDP-3-O-(3-hydroxymyristoyl)glucosamine N-acyltransferase [Saccharospirillum sp.]